MGPQNSEVENLQFEIDTLEAQVARLRIKMAELLAELESSNTSKIISNPNEAALGNHADTTIDSPIASNQTIGSRWPLDLEDYKRYGRQMILLQIGLKGQLRLKGAAVLIVGVGGLGCPAATYLAGAGVGTLGLVDGDTIETSNLHRQFLHASDRVGRLKVTSAIERLKQLNPKVHYRAHTSPLEPTTALSIIDHYDLVLDCTDHPTSRYLISDAVVLAGKPLVSASALRTEGQLLVLNNPPTTIGSRNEGFCYRCVFPRPPPTESVVSCGEEGILGPVVGVMGVLMATEAIKIIAAGQSLHTTSKTDNKDDLKGTLLAAVPSLLVYSAYSFPPFRSIRLRGKRPTCPSCSASASITRESLISGSLDYNSFCGIAPASNLLSIDGRVSAKEFKEKVKDRGIAHTLVDVREKTQYDICHLEDSLNIPLSTLCSHNDGDETVDVNSIFQQLIDGDPKRQDRPVYFVCRFGNDSQIAVRKMRDSLGFMSTGRIVQDIVGGLAAWRREVDPGFPEY